LRIRSTKKRKKHDFWESEVRKNAKNTIFENRKHGKTRKTRFLEIEKTEKHQRNLCFRNTDESLKCVNLVINVAFLVRFG